LQPKEKPKKTRALCFQGAPDNVFAVIMAFPVVEFSREGYKIRKVFG
jgi:hypothetical protein